MENRSCHPPPNLWTLRRSGHGVPEDGGELELPPEAGGTQQLLDGAAVPSRRFAPRQLQRQREHLEPDLRAAAAEEERGAQSGTNDEGAFATAPRGAVCCRTPFVIEETCTTEETRTTAPRGTGCTSCDRGDAYHSAKKHRLHLL
ncbi:hypothetical protein NDU88_008915 [Pleurodeles waltl]|uniref:Uncharacterized protein n=1 Tax=Pleurodeles waltl TaxID=8319 RepID=A0AAV7NXZ7_PLEWA|nr:hypothetical protein NDU88_008915 [Pleurodeles waltl]